MSRRQVSPLRTTGRLESDPRDLMIRKLKQDLIVARGREKELAILQSYLMQLIQRTKLLSAETAKCDEEGKLKLQITNKSINELKKQVQLLRSELKNVTIQLGQIQTEQSELKRVHNSKLIEIQKLKKEGASIHGDNQKLLNEHYRLRNMQDQTTHEIKKLVETIKDYQLRLSDVSRKVLEVKAYITELHNENQDLKSRLKNYEKENAGIDSQLDDKQTKIDILEKSFAEKHEQIKNQVQKYIELEYQNEKNQKQAKHKANLVKIETDKYNDLSSVIKKIEKNISQKSKELSQIRGDSSHISKINEEYANRNARLKQDLIYCQQHLHNLMKHNALIHEQMQNTIREDDAIIELIKRKRLIPITNNFHSLRASRSEIKVTSRSYQ